MIRIALFLLFLALVQPQQAHGEQVCVEQLSGVCLKYEERANKPAPPRQISRAEQVERDLGLTAMDQRQVQEALKKLGFYNGPIDGDIGAGTRRAIRDWEQKNEV